jgi:hypothetical protein
MTLEGEIDGFSDDDVIAAIRRRRPQGLVLNSSGGCAAEAQRIAYAVRERGLATRVEAGGECLSECTFILAAGAPRTAETGARVGVSPSLVTRGLGVYVRDRGPMAETAAYFTSMGVDGGKLAVLATSVGNAEIRTFTPQELRDLRLVDTKGPEAVTRVMEAEDAHPEGNRWFWLSALAAIVAVFWGISEIWARRRGGIGHGTGAGGA